jgi:glycosyltransferase involved in cell wall biosynthesis
VELLDQALRSALDQIYQDFVILVGDNSESDATEHLVASLGDPRIRYHRNRPQLGPMGNWLDLIKRAETPLVASLHDDDTWQPDYLASVVPPMLDDPSIAMTFTDYWVIDDDGNRLLDYTERESARTHRNVLPRGPFHYDREQGLRLVAVWNAPQPAYAAVLRRAEVMAVEFPADIDPLYDIWLSYRLVTQEAGIRYEPARLTNYRVHRGAATNAGFDAAEDAVFRRILAEHRDLPVTAEINRYWSTLRWSRATRLLSVGPEARARSQAELRAAGPGLTGLRRLVATAGGRSRLAWNGVRLAWTLRDKVHPPEDIRYEATVPG